MLESMGFRRSWLKRALITTSNIMEMENSCSHSSPWWQLKTLRTSPGRLPPWLVPDSTCRTKSAQWLAWSFSDWPCSPLTSPPAVLDQPPLTQDLISVDSCLCAAIVLTVIDNVWSVLISWQALLFTPACSPMAYGSQEPHLPLSTLLTTGPWALLCQQLRPLQLSPCSENSIFVVWWLKWTLMR